MFSRTCEYALQAVLFIAMRHDDGKAVGLTEIAASLDIPKHFLSKILQILVKNKILHSVKGPTGGFFLAGSPDQITLLEIVRIMDTLDIFERCGIGLKECSDKEPCPIHNDYTKIKDRIRSILTDKTIAQLCDDVRNGIAIVSLKKA